MGFHGEIFFSVCRLSKMEKLDVATLSFEGEALAWFQWEDGQRKKVSWDELKSRHLVRFGLTQEGSLCEKFLTLIKEGSMREL